MSIDLQNIVNSVREQYLNWSAKIPFAEVVYDGANVYDTIPFDFVLPPTVIRPESLPLDTLDMKIVNGLQQKETMNFIQRLHSAKEDHQFNASLPELSQIIGTAYHKMFEDIGFPDYIIFPRNLRAEYLKQIHNSAVRIDNMNVPSTILETTMNEIFMVIRRGFKKIYPSDRQIVIKTVEDSGQYTNTKFEITIRQKLEITDTDAFARIKITT